MGNQKRIAVWWIFPCKAVSGIFRELADLGFTVDVIFLHPISEERLKLGWLMPDFGRANLLFLPNVEQERKVFLNRFPFIDYDIHVINSIYGDADINYIVERVKEVNTPFVVLSEAPFNGLFGLRRIMKYLYLVSVVPFRAKKVAPYAQFVCCLSGASVISTRWLRWFGFRKDRIYPLGYFSEEPDVKRMEVGEIRNPPLLVCTGYLTRNKGHALLLQALCRVRARRLAFRCIITGFGPEKERLQAFIDQHQLGNNVQLVGVVAADELDRIQARADIFVAPGYEEPWAIRINEALQSGCPVVLSDRIGAAELVRSSGGGQTFRSGSVEGLAQALIDLLSNQNKLNAMKQRVLNYRARIHPREAARYLSGVISHTFEGTEKPGVPVWLQASDSSGNIRSPKE